ncbi:MAG: AraC family transcriptional regulator [Steroidobacteraceae bacterium]
MRRIDGGEIHRVYAGAPTHDVRCAGLSIHCAWGARYELRLDERALAFDDEVFVVAAPQRRVRGRLLARKTSCALTICYPPGAAAHLLAELPPGWHAGWRERDGELWPTEHIRPHRRSTELLLRFIASQIDDELDDPSWYEEQSLFLLQRLLWGDLRANDGSEWAQIARPTVRSALLRRLARVTDLIHSEYERRLTLADFATTANLSMFHALRSLKLLHGMTPCEFLQRRRLSAGLWMLGSTNEPVGAIAERVGFADRRAFYRQVARQCGLRPHELNRHQAQKSGGPHGPPRIEHGEARVAS